MNQLTEIISEKETRLSWNSKRSILINPSYYKHLVSIYRYTYAYVHMYFAQYQQAQTSYRKRLVFPYLG